MTAYTKLGLLTAIAVIGAACQPIPGINAQELSPQSACIIAANAASGATTLTGIARGMEGDTGHYRLTVKGGNGRNSTSTSQGGAFSIGPDGTANTGMVRLSSGGVYEATLQVSIGGQTESCSTRIGDRI